VPLTRFGGSGGRGYRIGTDELKRTRTARAFGARRHPTPRIGGLELVLRDGGLRRFGDVGGMLLGEWLLAEGEVPIGLAASWGDMVDGLSLITSYTTGAA
jgi:hypothetical protein